MTELEPALPPGPYRVEWPAEQGGAFTLWGRQGTPPDFKDGWAIPLVASGVDTALYALRNILNATTPAPRENGWGELRRLAEAATPGPWHAGDRGVGWEVHIRPHPETGCWAQLPDGSWPEELSITSGPKDLFDGPDAAYIAAVSPDVVLRLLAAARGEPGTETNCPLEGVHEHAFRGPHRFREWEPGI